MDALDQLRTASAAFLQRVDLVRPEHLGLRTPCPQWDVAGLLRHVIGGDHGYVALLGGASTAEFHSVAAGITLSGDISGQARDSAAAEIAAFSAPGALDTLAAHPAGMISGATLLGFRVVEWTIHGWDLARALGTDESLDPALAAALHETLSARAGQLAASGYFAPPVELPDGAPPAARLVALLGRRPQLG